MSGLSKALRYAVLVAAIGGCSMNSSRQETVTDEFASQESTATSQDSISEASIGDVAATTDGASISNETAASPESNVAVGQDLARGEGPFAVFMTQASGNTRFVLNTGDSETKYAVKTQESPARVVIDLLDRPSQIAKTLPIEGDNFVRTVRVGGHSDRTRFVFDLAKDESGAIAHNVEQEGQNIVVSFAPTEGASTASASNVSTGDIPPAVVARETVTAQNDNSESSISTNESTVAANSETIALEDLRFAKTATSLNGEVTLVLSDQVPFYLKRTTPTEYVLTLPGVSPADRALTPLVTPATSAGIRSARAVQEGDNTLIRMFVDPTIELTARPVGNNVVIAANNSASSEARAQLQPEAAKPEDAAAPTSATGAPAALIAGGGDDETAKRNPTGISSADGSKIYTGRLISLDLQETDIDNALRIIAEVSNLNIIASDDVTGKVTLRLIDVPWDQALDVILKTNGLDQVTEGNVIRIAPVDKLRQEREALREAKKAAENLEDLKVKYIRISYARATDLKEQVEAVLSERGTVAVDERTNQLIVKDIGKGQDEVAQLIKRLDLRTPQVLLETQIVEAGITFLRDLGFQWTSNYVQSPQTGNATGAVFPNSVDLGGNFGGPVIAGSANAITAVLDSADGSRALSAAIQFAETEGKVKVISRPQVATVNNKQAEIRSVTTLRVRLPDSGLSVATGQGATASGSGQSAFEEIEVGITLKVTPQASPDYYVLMDIDAKSSTLGASEQSVDNIPPTIDRQATSTVLIKSGQTFALGGVYRIEDNEALIGVPFMKDIPVLGQFFRSSSIDNRDEELIFFITPHIVEGSFDPSLM